MTFLELQHEARHYRGAFLLEAVIAAPRLHRLVRMFRWLFFIALGFVVLSFLFSRAAFFAEISHGAAAAGAAIFPITAGLAYIALSLWLLSALLFAFFVSFYCKDSVTVLPEPFFHKRPAVTYAAALSLGKAADAVIGFFHSRCGASLAFRLGISGADVVEFLGKRTEIISPESLVLRPWKGENTISFRACAETVFRASPELRSFLARQAVSEADFAGAAAWIERNESLYKKLLRFWSRDSLGRIPGIAKNWAYGETAFLERYAVEITKHPAFVSGSGVFCKRETEDIERILSRGREANVLLVGEEGAPKMAAVARLARRILSGVVLPPLEHKRIFIFDGALFASALKEKSAFENELLRLLSEAERAGNIIFVFDNFHAMLSSASSIGSDVLSLIDSFLISLDIQIIALAETGAYRQALEPNPKIRERFEKVNISGTGAEAMIPVLEDEAFAAEVRDGVFFTYQSIRALAESAERYFFEAAMADKAVDLLREVVSSAKMSGISVISREDVLLLVSRKTGIAAADAGEEERRKLLRLEEILHERIVGQDEAIKTIAGALRRARAGVGNPNKPIGSFLFLGPTGVGKTETTKALAEAMFGDEKIMTRFDMSEFQTADALDRFIGAFGSGKAGVFASAIRERPYGVLLLDEFEKTNADIHHLFLQILDEGFFTDAKGARVNARNLMIVATSNAGSDLIWSQIRGADSPQNGGTDAAAKLNKDAIIAEIINRGVFKPELLNRFDGVILFHPLAEEHLRIIARIQLERLAKRLKEKGLELVISDALLDYLVSVGQDPKFGARPMNRAIADKVEQKIADKLLRGEIFAGSRIELSVEDLS